MFSVGERMFCTGERMFRIGERTFSNGEYKICGGKYVFPTPYCCILPPVHRNGYGLRGCKRMMFPLGVSELFGEYFWG